MSRQHINHYRKHIAQLMASSGSKNEGVVSKAFGDLLERMGRSSDLVFVPQWEAKGPKGNDIRIDGALVPGVLRIPFGYWEAKDEKDDLEKEIAAKRAKGYPVDNIIFEDTKSAVLIQNGIEIDRAPLQGDDAALLALLNRFFAYQRPEIAEFRKAAAQFRSDLPQILGALRDALDTAERENADYRQKAQDFLAHTRDAINMAVSAADVREMLIQHILTEAIFARVFDDANYHRENNVARQLTALEQAFFTGALRKVTVDQLKPYYAAITHAATQIADRREKQTFLKRLYEDFYKVYNPNAADRLGVVYTPGEIVRFMIRATDQLCEQHFGKSLIDSGVDILDPATGTGTFIVELLEHFQGDRDKLRHKYKEELHANEVAILPYYVANLNIEATYAAISGQYADFPGLVFVDTLDNTAGLGKYAGHMDDMFGGTSAENLTRVKRQNDRKISVVIGNPPYNANQKNENDDNRNREYHRIDSRIKNTYVRLSTAQKTKSYDMYTRFFRWATDRIKEDGVVAFITNRSFIETKTMDGFRRSVYKDFSKAIVIDLGGDFKNPGPAGSANVFGIGTGVAITFLIKDSQKTNFSLKIANCPDFSAKEKLIWIDSADIDRVSFTISSPVDSSNWKPLPVGDWSTLIPVIDKDVKSEKIGAGESAIFSKYALGISTNRDDWVYAKNKKDLIDRIKHFVRVYRTVNADVKHFPIEIKWSSTLKRKKKSNHKENFEKSNVSFSNYRPYTKIWSYLSSGLVDRPSAIELFFPGNYQNIAICFNSDGARADFLSLAIRGVADLHFGDSRDGYQQAARFRYLKNGVKLDNVTDWAVQLFRERYSALPDGNAIGKDDIFAYVYAALHDPLWRETYAADLRRSFPRIKFHADFATWRDWGQRLLDLHIGYEQVEPWGLQRVDVPTDPSRKREGSSVSAVKLKLKSDPDNGAILVDSLTTLKGVPRAAWAYKLGNRSAIDWVLDQHKEKTPRDPTVAAKFNTYRFAEHKDKMIDLLDRVVRVSVETVAITDAMRAVQGPREN